MTMEVEDIIDIYRQRWEIELLFKQLKQNFPLKYFYGESANAIKIQIWVTLIANLLLMVIKKRIKRSWSFSGLASMVRIMLMYYVNCYTFLEEPEKDWAKMVQEAKDPLNLWGSCFLPILAFFSRDGLSTLIKSATFALPKSANIGKNKE